MAPRGPPGAPRAGGPPGPEISPRAPRAAPRAGGPCPGVPDGSHPWTCRYPLALCQCIVANLLGWSGSTGPSPRSVTECDGSDTINTPLGESESRWCLGTPSVTVTARAVPGRPAGSRLAIANDPPPLAGFPDLGPDGAQVWRRFGDRRHVSQLLSAQVCAHSPAGSGAPSHLELRHSLQVLGCSAGGRPLPPPGLIAPDNSGPGLRPTASGCRPRPLVVRGSGQWAGPPPGGAGQTKMIKIKGLRALDTKGA